jgi:hypothetical protein
MYMLVNRHGIDGTQLDRPTREVALHRDGELVPLGQVPADYGGIGQQCWEAWRRRRRSRRSRTEFRHAAHYCVDMTVRVASSRAGGMASSPATIDTRLITSVYGLPPPRL